MNSTETFFFYDLETSGVDARTQRIMQFAGQRTTMALEPIGEPYNVLVRLSDDVIPDPIAIRITGITPQQVAGGITETEFVTLLQNEICTPGTILTGFNSVRFDDEFLRYTSYRNLADPYEWAWKDGRSRWDLLDVVRMTRALRPDGVTWPFSDDGRPNNKLEQLSQANGLEHAKAHDALSDVIALIAVAKLLRAKQPKLFDYLLSHRNKREVGEVVRVHNPSPFVYSSGRYPILQHHTTAAVALGQSGRMGAVVVYDLRQDPAWYAELSDKELASLQYATKERRASPDYHPFPAKDLVLNRCPAVAPIGVLDEPAQATIGLTMATVTHNWHALQASNLGERLTKIFAKGEAFPKGGDVDAALYDGFVGDGDKAKLVGLRQLSGIDVATVKNTFVDVRLDELVWRYRARNFPDSLTGEERTKWDLERAARITARLPDFAKKFEEAHADATPKQLSALEDLRLWIESIYPAE